MLLATLDVEDLATPKIKAARNALDDLAVGARTQVGAYTDLARQFPAITQSVEQMASKMTASAMAQEKVIQVQRVQASAFSALLSGLQRGVPVTQLQARAFTELSGSLQQNTTYTQRYGGMLASLNDQLKAGATYTPQMERQLRQLGAGFQVVTGEVSGANTGLSALRENTVAVAAGFGLLGGGLTALLKESGLLAARIETLQVVEGIVAKNARLSSTEMMIQADAIKGLGITTQEANDAVLQFVQSNLRLSDASKIARAAQDLAVIAGENSSQTFKRLTTAISTTETMLLRQVGIVTTNEQIYREYAATLGKTWQQLSQVERQQAIVNKILDAGKGAAGAYEAAMGTAGKQVSSFARYIEESKLALGQSLLPTISLVVSALTEMLKWWIALPAPVQAAAAAMLSAAAAAATLSAALAASKFLGITGLIANLVGAFGNLFVALRAGYPILTAIQLSLGLWPTIIAAVVTAIGLGVGAWVAYSNATRETTEQLQKNLAVSIEHSEAFDKVATEAIKLQKVMDDLHLRGIKPTVEQEEAHRQAMEKLLGISPRMVQVLDAETRSYRLLTNEVNAARRAKQEEVQQDLQSLAVREAKLSAQKGDIEKKLREAQDLMGQIQRGEVSNQLYRGMNSAVIEDRSKVVAQTIETLKNQLKEVSGAAKVAKDALQDAMVRTAPAAEQATVAFTKSKEVLNEYIAKLAATGVATDTLAERMAKTKTAQRDLDNAMKDGPQATQNFLVGLDKLWNAYQAKQQQRLKALQQSEEQFRQSLEHATPQMLMHARVLNEVLGKAQKSGDTAEYNRLLNEQGASILKLGSSAELASRGFKVLADARETILQRADPAFWNKQVQEIENFGRALADAAKNSAEQLASEGATMQRDFEQERVDALRESALKIEEIDQQIYERRVVSQMNAKDQALYAEQQRLAGVERALQREQQLRTESLQREREAVNERQRLAELEIAKMIQRFELERSLRRAELQAELEIAQLQGRTDQAETLQRQIEVYDRVTEKLKERIPVLQAVAQTEIAVGAATQRAILDQRQQLNDQLTTAENAALERQRADSARTQQEIRRDYSYTFQLIRDGFANVIQSAVNGFAELLTGARSFKDVFLGIWRSIRDTILGIFEDIVRGWLKNASKMATQGGGFDIGKFFGTLLGRGGSVGGSALGVTGGVGTLVDPMTGAAVRGGGSGGFLSTGLGGGLVGGAAGGMIGFGIGSATKSRTWGTLSGLGAGAGIGAMLGGPVGAAVGGGIGAVAGFIGGLVGINKEWQQVKQMRADLEAQHGGWEKLAADAAKAGYNIKNLWDAKTTKDLNAEIEKLNKAFELENLKKARDQFVSLQGGMDALRQKAEQAGIDIDKALSASTVEDLNTQLTLVQAKFALMAGSTGFKALDEAAKGGLTGLRKQLQFVGEDIKKVFSATTIEEFNESLARVNGKLADQQKLVEALSGIAMSGLANIGQGLTASLEKDLETTLKGMLDSDELKTLEEKVKNATGFTGTNAQYALLHPKEIGLSTEEIERLTKVVDNAKGSFAALGSLTASTFSRIVRETGSIRDALAQTDSAWKEVASFQKTYGLEVDEATRRVLSLRDAFESNKDVVQIFDGITAAVGLMNETNIGSIEDINRFGKIASDQWDKLMSRHVAEDQALAMIQPTLQALWEAQQRFGVSTDESTQKLINMGVEQGIVGENFRSSGDKMLEILVLIAEALGADIPEAYKKHEQAANDAGQAAQQQAKDTADELVNTKEQVRQMQEAYKRFYDNESRWDLTGGVTDLQDVVDRFDVTGLENSFVRAARNINDTLDSIDLEGLGDRAEEAGARVEDAGTYAAHGHSPTGLKEIGVVTDEAVLKMEHLQDVARDVFGNLETVAATWAHSAFDAADTFGNTLLSLGQKWEDLTSTPLQRQLNGIDRDRISQLRGIEQYRDDPRYQDAVDLINRMAEVQSRQVVWEDRHAQEKAAKDKAAEENPTSAGISPSRPPVVVQAPNPNVPASQYQIVVTLDGKVITQNVIEHMPDLLRVLGVPTTR